MSLLVLSETSEKPPTITTRVSPSRAMTRSPPAATATNRGARGPLWSKTRPAMAALAARKRCARLCATVQCQDSSLSSATAPETTAIQ